MNRLRAKLYQKKGETLAEALVAILVSAVALLLLSSLIMASTRIVGKGEKSMEIMYDGATVMDTKPSTLPTLEKKSQPITVTYSNGSSTISTITVNIYRDNTSKLVSYQRD